MLKLRIASILILLPLVVLAIIFLPTLYVAIAAAIVFGLAAMEWLSMITLQDRKRRMMLLVLLIGLAFSILYAGFPDYLLYWCAIIAWALGLAGICYFPSGRDFWASKLVQPVLGLTMFIPAWLAVVQLHGMPDGYVWLLLALSLIWGADIGAYCAGRLWGKEKLLEKVSPGKTWAGFYGALVTGIIIISVFYYFYKPNFSYQYAAVLALLTVMFSVVGDLVESMFKRIYGIKDSGQLIPGHGGVYDRLDSTLAALPIFIIGLQMLI